ncbi:transcriptional repressor LexA [Mesobacillus subterraneus]|uniref:transcriptional repressor LexA n=1 Tax=Mesobacillus subterraneus TaxID=285983 RepID=UPI00203D7F1D|nr:transcriptional repressor LexA [Mesobacillus subterraneus]MCM3573332.1 transcriptional repressor LexA [Mesobacillus subterraneus]
MSKEKKFGSYLRSLREDRKFTVRGLATKSGVSAAYLSLVENGKKGIPSPEILKKLYGPLDVTYDELMERAGYITSDLRSELLPETIRTMEGSDDLNQLIDNAADLLIKSATHQSGHLKASYKNYFLAEAKEAYGDYDQEELSKLLDNPRVIQKMFEHLTLEEKISFLNIIIEDFVEKEIDPLEVLGKAPEKRYQVLKVPVLGHIAAGLPIMAYDHVEEWMEIPNAWNLQQGEVFVLKVKGDSMIGSRIYDGDKVIVKIQNEVENGEIAVVNVNGDEATLKRVKKTENGQVILFPDNPRYEPIFITNENARIIGKVIQVMFEPK